MNKPSAVRISFTSLKNQQNQQSTSPKIYPQSNKLIDFTFRNIKNIQKNMHLQNIQAQSFSASQILVKNEVSQNVSPRIDNSSSCSSSSCRFTNLIKQLNHSNNSSCSQTQLKIMQQHKRSINDNNNLKFSQQNVDQLFNNTQFAIKQKIQLYNQKYAQVGEILADLHIKDLMKFNQILQKNEQFYFQIKEDANFINKNQIKFYQIGSEDIQKIYQVQRVILQITTQKNKSFDFRSTYESKNKNIGQGQSLKVSPQLIKQTQSSNRLIKKDSQKFQNLVESFQQQFSSKLNKGKQINYKKRIQNSNQNLQDTPESVKSKIIFTSKIKAQKLPQIGMFDRIDVCQSVEPQQQFDSNNNQNQNKSANINKKQSQLTSNGQKYRVKKDYRYGRSSQQ